MKKTEFFDGAERPVRPGVYERKRILHMHIPNKPARTATGYSRWNGDSWMVTFGTVAQAARATSVSAYQSVAWRGLKEQA